MFKAKKKGSYRPLLLVEFTNLLLFFGYFLNGFFQYDMLKISIYTAIIVSWNFLSIVTIVVIERIGQKKKTEVVE